MQTYDGVVDKSVRCRRHFELLKLFSVTFQAQEEPVRGPMKNRSARQKSEREDRRKSDGKPKMDCREMGRGVQNVKLHEE